MSRTNTYFFDLQNLKVPNLLVLSVFDSCFRNIFLQCQRFCCEKTNHDQCCSWSNICLFYFLLRPQDIQWLHVLCNMNKQCTRFFRIHF